MKQPTKEFLKKQNAELRFDLYKVIESLPDIPTKTELRKKYPFSFMHELTGHFKSGTPMLNIFK